MTSGLLRRRLDPAERYGLRATLFAAAILVAGIPFALLVVQVTREGPLQGWDAALAGASVSLVNRYRWLPVASNVVTDLGSAFWLYPLVGGASLYLWRRGRVRAVVYLVVSTVGTTLIATVTKEVVGRARPELGLPLPGGSSFPSGHALNSVVVYGALLLVILPLISAGRRRWAVGGALVVTLVVGLSRLGLGVHYPSDVLGGYLLGLAWLAASTAAFSIWREESRPPGPP